MVHRGSVLGHFRHHSPTFAPPSRSFPQNVLHNIANGHMTSGQRSLLRQVDAPSAARDSAEHTAAELAELLGRRQDSVVASLRRLPAEWVSFREDASGRTGRGIPAGYWSLTDAGRRALEAHADDATIVRSDETASESTAARTIRRQQAVVTATVTSRQVPALLDVLADGEQAVEASFVARIDGGKRHRFLFVFDAELGTRPAEMLSAVLEPAGLPFELGTVAEVRDIHALIRDARAARATARVAAQRRPR